MIESFNKQIKKYSHRKEQFQNEESMERFLVSSFDTYNQKFLGRSHKGFQQAEGELEQMLSQLIVSNSPSVDSSTLFDREPRIWRRHILELVQLF